MDRIEQIKRAHNHSKRACEVCFLLDELTRQGAEPRVAEAEHAALIAEEARSAAEEDADHYRDKVRLAITQLEEVQAKALSDLESLRRELIAVGLARAGLEQERDALARRLTHCRWNLETLRDAATTLPKTPRLQSFVDDLVKALGEL